MKVENRHKIKVEYTGTLEDGQVFDTSKGKEPLEFIVGEKMVIKGFEDAVMGMEKGKSKKISIEPEEAYGMINPQLVQEVPKEQFGEDKDKIKAGMTVGIKAPTGQVMPVKVAEVTKDKVKLDMNHPLAGKKLNFEIKVVDVKKLAKKEQEELKKAKEVHACEVGCGDKCSTC
ncbi:peptidylprolyl isomerase [Candidatus Woesearchaeota archaeon]|nr:peptidylprolyl isomerase [Candidatus Woesearchaeota archaeon]